MAKKPRKPRKGSDGGLDGGKFNNPPNGIEITKPAPPEGTQQA